MTTNFPGCGWTAVSNDGFLSVSSGATGTGSGTVGYAAAANAAVSFRTGTLTIAGQTVTVTQAGTGPSMAVDRTALYYGGVTSGASFNSQTLGQTVRLTQSGAARSRGPRHPLSRGSRSRRRPARVRRRSPSAWRITRASRRTGAPAARSTSRSTARACRPVRLPWACASFRWGPPSERPDHWTRQPTA